MKFSANFPSGALPVTRLFQMLAPRPWQLPLGLQDGLGRPAYTHR